MSYCTKEDWKLYRHGQMPMFDRTVCSVPLKSCPECTRHLEKWKENELCTAELHGSFPKVATVEQKQRIYAENSL